MPVIRGLAKLGSWIHIAGFRLLDASHSTTNGGRWCAWRPRLYLRHAAANESENHVELRWVSDLEHGEIWTSMDWWKTSAETMNSQQIDIVEQVFATRLLLLQLQHPTIWLLDWHLQAFSRIQTWKPPESSSCQQHNITQWDCRNHATICHWQRPFASLFIDRMYFAIDFSCHQLHPTLLRGARFNPNSPLRALTLSPLRRAAVFPWWTSRSAE